MRVLALCLLVVLASPALAGGHPDAHAIVGHIFEVADADQDGFLSPDEYADAGLEQFGSSFADCDADQDGRLTSSEYLEFYDRHHPPVDESPV